MPSDRHTVRCKKLVLQWQDGETTDLHGELMQLLGRTGFARPNIRRLQIWEAGWKALRPASSTKTLSPDAFQEDTTKALKALQRLKSKRRGGSELTPTLAANLEETPQDLLDQARPEDLVEESTSDPPSAGPLARKMWKCAMLGVRNEEIWARFVQRVLLTGALTGPKDVSLMFRAFARIKYRDRKALDTLSPFILRHVDSFSTHELALILAAHKKLEYERTDNIHLLVSIICQRKEEWTGQIVALTCNAVAHFYIYRPRFWRMAAMSLINLVWTMSPLELTILVSAMARVDRRDEQALAMIAKMCTRCAKRHLFNQETLATTMNAFAKLDYNNAKLAKALEEAALVKLNLALEIGPQYRS